MDELKSPMQAFTSVTPPDAASRDFELESHCSANLRATPGEFTC